MKRTLAVAACAAISVSLALVLHCSVQKPSEPDETPVSVTEFQDLSLTPEGGTYELDGGLTVIVPAEAVDQDTVVRMRAIGTEELEALAESRGTSADDVYIAVAGEPDGMVFNVPIMVRAEIAIEPGECPIPYDLDLKERTATPALATVGIDPDCDIVTLYLEHFSGRSVELTPAQKAENKRGEEDCLADPCRCGPMKRRVLDVDVVCQDGQSTCQIIDSKEEYTYLDCNRTFSGRRIEVKGDCRPKMTLETARSEISTTETTDLTVRAWLGCPSYPLKTTPVTYTNTGPADLSTETQNTDNNGVSTVTLTARDEEGEAEVTARVQAVYYDSYQLTTGHGIEEPKYGNTIAKDTSVSVSVTIKDEALLTLTSDKTSMTGFEYATLTSTVKKGSTPAVGDMVIITVEDGEYGEYYLFPFASFEPTSPSGESVSLIQFHKPGTHRVIATCMPTSLGIYEELADTITITSTAVEERWTGTMTINAPLNPDWGGPVAYGTLTITFTFDYNSWDGWPNLANLSVTAEQDLTVEVIKMPNVTIGEKNVPGSPPLSLIGSVTHNPDRNGFRTDDRDFTGTFRADDVFFSYTSYFSSGEVYSNASGEIVEIRDAKLVTEPQTGETPYIPGDWSTYTLVFSK